MLLFQELLLLLYIKFNLVDELYDSALLVFCDLQDCSVQLIHARRSLHLDAVVFIHLFNEDYFACHIFAASEKINVKELMWLLMVIEGHIMQEF